MTAPAPRVGYRAALANAEFRGITVAQIVSECGDQIARIALAVLVFRDQHSVALTALTYAVSYLPLVLGGALLAPVADRWPRRRVMLLTHAARAVLVALIAVPGLPLVVSFLLLAGVTLFEAPFSAARAALVPDLIDDGPTYVAAVSLGRALNQVDQAVGFFLGGVVVAVASPRAAMLIDSAAFFAALVITIVSVERRPAPTADDGSRGYFAELAAGSRLVFRDPVLRALIVLVWLGGLTLMLPEGVAVVYAHDEGAGSAAGGALTAAVPLGLFLGIVALTRWVPARRQTDLLLAMEGLAGLFLAATAVRPPVPVVFILWLLSGAFQAYIVPAIAMFNLAVPGAARGRAVSIAAAGLALTQGVALGLGGLLAAAIGTAGAVAWSGVVGLAGLAVLRSVWPFQAVSLVADRLLAYEAVPVAEIALADPATPTPLR